MTGLGGGGFAACYDAASAEMTFLDFFVAVPGLHAPPSVAALQPVDICFGGVPLEFAIGAASVGVPGVAAGCHAVHARFGRLSWQEILAPAIRLAEHGASLPAAHARALAAVAPALLPGDGSCAYAPHGALLQSGQRLRHPGLAGTMQQLADEGAASFYTGDLADRIAAAVQAEGGILNRADLAAYRVRETPAHSAQFSGYQVWGRRDHAGTVDALAAVDVVLSGDVDKRVRGVARALNSAPTSQLGDTTNVAAVDAAGNACVITTSLGVGSGVWVSGSGVHLNSMLGEGELRASAVQPGSRMASMMSPLVVLDDRCAVRLAVGAAGASRIRSALTHTLIATLADGVDLPAAVARPRFHPVRATAHVESGLDDEVCDALVRAGYALEVWSSDLHYFGGVSGVGDGAAAGDPRRDGHGAVYSTSSTGRTDSITSEITELYSS